MKENYITHRLKLHNAGWHYPKKKNDLRAWFNWFMPACIIYGSADQIIGVKCPKQTLINGFIDRMNQIYEKYEF